MTEDPIIPARTLYEDGPYLQAAMLCEKVLVERDGVKSAIRIIDRINHSAEGVGQEPPQEMPEFDYDLVMLIKFKSGTARGPMELSVRLERPSGESPSPFRQEIYFEGEDDRGNDIVVNMRLKIEHQGLHWFNIRLAGRTVTRVPLRVVYLRTMREASAS